MSSKMMRSMTVVLLAATCSPLFAQPADPPPTTTLWNFLGIPQAINKIHGATFNRRGNHPGLEKKPPLKGLAHPANLKSDVPAIKAAAEIKQAEDLKAQKIKAIKYLATIGCGCYDKDEKVTKALLAAMEDCTEEVRLEAVRAISLAASGEFCTNCKQQSCCNEKITAMLYKIAYELDDLGCHVEPSERVRAAAVEALGICCPNALPITPESIPATGPVEGVPSDAPVEGVPATPPADVVPSPADVPPPPPVSDAAQAMPSRPVDPNAFLRDASLAVLDRARETAPAPAPTMQTMRRQAVEPQPIAVPYEPAPIRESVAPPPGSVPSSRRTAKAKTVSASMATSSEVRDEAIVLQLVDIRRNLAHVHFPNAGQPVPVGTRFQVFRPGPTGLIAQGQVEVVESFSGSATVRALDGLNVATLPRETVLSR